MSELWKLDAVDLARLIRDGAASAREAVDSCLARLEAVNPSINAVVRTLGDDAREDAARADAARARGEPLGLLHGVPVTTKINTDQAGCPTDNGIAAFRDLVPPADNPVIANLRKAGAIIIGRTNAPAFSMRVFSDNAIHGNTVNVLDRRHSAGGSSGGAGAAVAAGIGPIAQGNDIGGSVRIPAFYNGIVGLRVSLGRIPAFNPSQINGRPIGNQLMAVQGPLTRTVRDARLALEVMAAGDPRDSRWADVALLGPPAPRPVKVALVAENPGGKIHPAQAEAVREAGRRLADAGYAVEEKMPPDPSGVIRLWHAIGTTDVFGFIWPAMQKYGDPDGQASMQHWLDLFPPVDSATFMAALRERELMMQAWATFMIEYPIVVMPTMGDLAPLHRLDTTRLGQESILDAIRASLISPVLGIPSLAIPVGAYQPLRAGVQIMAPRFREDLCLQAGEAVAAGDPPAVVRDPA